MTEETWRDIEGFEEAYQISNLGRVKSLPKWMGNRLSKELIMTPKTDRYGYHRITLCCQKEKGKRRYFTIHRLVAKAFIPNPKNKPEVNHKDGDKKNNKVENLDWVTNKENIDHAWESGLKEHSREVASLTHGKRCALIDLITEEKIEFSSMRKLSAFLGFNQRWLDQCIKKNKDYMTVCLEKGYKIDLG